VTKIKNLEYGVMVVNGIAHPDIIDWLAKNWIDPDIVPLAEVPFIGQSGLIACNTYVRIMGRHLLAENNEPVMTTTVVALRVKPTGIVEDWLNGYVDALGQSKKVEG
jgi:hypothetical protein